MTTYVGSFADENNRVRGSDAGGDTVSALVPSGTSPSRPRRADLRDQRPYDGADDGAIIDYSERLRLRLELASTTLARVGGARSHLRWGWRPARVAEARAGPPPLTGGDPFPVAAPENQGRVSTRWRARGRCR